MTSTAPAAFPIRSAFIDWTSRSRLGTYEHRSVTVGLDPDSGGLFAGHAIAERSRHLTATNGALGGVDTTRAKLSDPGVARAAAALTDAILGSGLLEFPQSPEWSREWRGSSPVGPDRFRISLHTSGDARAPGAHHTWEGSISELQALQGLDGLGDVESPILGPVRQVLAGADAFSAALAAGSTPAAAATMDA